MLTKSLNTLLPTGVIEINDKLCRVALDSMSDMTYVTEKCLRKLGTERFEVNECYIGLNQVPTEVKYATVLKIDSPENGVEIKAHLVNEIATLPGIPKVPFENWPFIKKNSDRVADIYPRGQVNIEILLGADAIPLILKRSYYHNKSKLVAEVTKSNQIILWGLLDGDQSPKRCLLAQ